MSGFAATLVGAVRVVHPAPTVAVVSLSAVLGGILVTQAGLPPGLRVVLTGLAVLGSQVLTGAVNDWADRDRDALAQPGKPIPRGQISPVGALVVAAGGLALQVAASIPLGPLPLALGLAASASAFAYNLWLAATPLSVLPYLVSFGLLPLWVAAGVGVPLERVAIAPLLVAPFAAAAHLANTVRDFDADAAMRRRTLAQLLGRRAAFWVAWLLALSVGLGAGAAAALSGSLGPVAALLGVVGLAAIAQGAAGAQRLWLGMLAAAVAWTAAWALASG